MSEKSAEALKTIGEVAKELNLIEVETGKAKTYILRFWEKEFPELNPKKSEAGARKYSTKDMELLRKIHFLVKEKGFTLEGARQKLKHAPEDSIQTEDLVRRLQNVKAELDQLAKTIKTLP